MGGRGTERVKARQGSLPAAGRWEGSFGFCHGAQGEKGEGVREGGVQSCCRREDLTEKARILHCPAVCLITARHACVHSLLGLNAEEVFSETLLQVDPAQTQTLHERIESVARDILQGKESSTMAAYMPIMQKALAWSWYLQQKQHRQQQDSSHTAAAAGAVPGQEQQAGAVDDGGPGLPASQQYPSSSLVMNVRAFTTFVTAAEKPAEGIRQEFARVLSGGSTDASSDRSSSSRAQQLHALSAGGVRAVQVLRQLVQGVPGEVSLHQGRLSFGNWKKHLSACTYLQEKQQHILYGKTRRECIPIQSRQPW